MTPTAKIEIPIFYGEIWVWYEDTLEEVSNHYEIGGDPNEFDGFFFRVYDNGYIQYHIALKKDIEHHKIIHEIVHLCNALMKDRGILLDPDNDETQAYLMGWMCEQIFKSIGT